MDLKEVWPHINAQGLVKSKADNISIVKVSALTICIDEIERGLHLMQLGVLSEDDSLFVLASNPMITAY